MVRLQARFPHAVAIQFAPPPTAGERRRGGAEERSDHQIALDFVADVRGEPASDAESALLRDACESCAHDPEGDVLVGAP
jgi:exonuclease SbcD